MQKIKVTAPTRVDLAGGTLDLWPLYTLWGHAKTINLAISLHAVTEMTVENHHGFEVILTGVGGASQKFSRPLLTKNDPTIPQPLQFPVALVSQYFNRFRELPRSRFQIKIGTQAPPQSGLGGSSTLAVSLLRALTYSQSEMQGQRWQWEILDWVRDFEASYLGVPTGTQDYLAALFGGLSCFESAIGGVTHTNYPESVQRSINDRLLVIYSGELHDSGSSNWEIYRRAMEQDPSMLAGLKAIRDVAESLDTELRKPSIDWKALGGLINTEWDLRKKVFKVETARIDELITFFRSHGVLGIKVCGAAKGGSLMALVEPEKRAAMIDLCAKERIQVLSAQAISQGVEVT